IRSGALTGNSSAPKAHSGAIPGDLAPGLLCAGTCKTKSVTQVALRRCPSGVVGLSAVPQKATCVAADFEPKQRLDEVQVSAVSA
ncbi:MAG: hypothetical protein WA766_12840, partial [Candidatus Acidiferrales bacterium]